MSYNFLKNSLQTILNSVSGSASASAIIEDPFNKLIKIRNNQDIEIKKYLKPKKKNLKN